MLNLPGFTEEKSESQWVGQGRCSKATQLKNGKVRVQFLVPNPVSKTDLALLTAWWGTEKL